MPEGENGIECSIEVVDQLVDALVPEVDRASVRAVLGRFRGADAVRVRTGILRLLVEDRMGLEQAAMLALVDRTSLVAAAGFDTDTEAARRWISAPSQLPDGQ